MSSSPAEPNSRMPTYYDPEFASEIVAYMRRERGASALAPGSEPPSLPSAAAPALVPVHVTQSADSARELASMNS